MSAEEEKKVAKVPMIVQDESQFANLMDTARFEQMWRVALAFAASKLVPDQFKKDPESCFVAIHMALRLDLDPLVFLQKSYVVKGRPGIEATVIIALINKSGLFTGPLKWRFTGTQGKEDWTCIAYATHVKTGELYELPIDWKTVKGEGWFDKDGSKWRTMPEQMFRYRTATWFGRTYCPEVTMGLHTVDELEDMTTAIDVTPKAIQKTLDRADAMKKQIAQQQAPAEAPATETKPADEEPPLPEEPPAGNGGLPLQSPSTDPRPHTEQQWKKLHALAPKKFTNGVEELHATICMDLKHDSAKEITFDEASALIDLIERMPDIKKGESA